MKELLFPYENCPHCGGDVKDFCKREKPARTDDVEKVDDQKYGVQARWKDVFVCPHCGQKFYIHCEH